MLQLSDLNNIIVNPYVQIYNMGILWKIIYLFL
jgi:hypothetical protein